MVSDWLSWTARGYGAVHQLSISNGNNRTDNARIADPSTDDTSADGDDGNYGATGDDGGGGAGSSNVRADIATESDTSGVSPAGRPLAFRM